MKILFVSPAYPPKKNAIGEYVKWLALELLKNNHDVGILTAYNGSEFANSTSANNKLDFKELNYKEDRIDIFPCIKNWKFDFKDSLVKLTTYYEPDVISLQYEPYSYEPNGLPFFLVKAFNRIQNYKISITFHEVYARDYLWGNKHYYIVYILQKSIAKKLCKFSAVSFTALDLYMKVFKNDKIKKLYVGSNVQAEVLAESRRSFFLERNNKFILISFGIKNYDIILEALKLLKSKKVTAFEYHIVGDLSTAVTKKIFQNIEMLQIKDNVWVRGYMESKELGELFSRSHLFIDNNYIDTKKRGGTTLKSGSLAAAFQYGLPILGYDGDMTDPILRHKKNIWFCNASTPTEISEEILFLMTKSDSLFSLHHGSKELYKTYLSWPAIAKTFITNISEKINENC